MAIVNLSEASRLTGKSRDTLYRHIRTGKVSVAKDTLGQSGYLFDTSELIRAYGGIKASRNRTDSTPAELQKSDTIVQYRTPEIVHQNNDVSVEVRILRELLEEKDKRIEDLQKAMLMLADKTPKKRWFQF